MHKRTQIRKKIATRLQTSLPSEISMFTSKVMTLQEETLPACMVYFDRGDKEQRTIDAVDTETDAIINIELVDRDSVNIDNRLDAWSEIIESALLNDYELGGLVEDLSHTSFEFLRDDQLPLGSLILSFSVKFED